MRTYTQCATKTPRPIWLFWRPAWTSPVRQQFLAIVDDNKNCATFLSQSNQVIIFDHKYDRNQCEPWVILSVTKLQPFNFWRVPEVHRMINGGIYDEAGKR